MRRKPYSRVSKPAPTSDVLDRKGLRVKFFDERIGDPLEGIGDRDGDQLRQQHQHDRQGDPHLQVRPVGGPDVGPQEPDCARESGPFSEGPGLNSCGHLAAHRLRGGVKGLRALIEAPTFPRHPRRLDFRLPSRFPVVDLFKRVPLVRRQIPARYPACANLPQCTIRTNHLAAHWRRTEPIGMSSDIHCAGASANMGSGRGGEYSNEHSNSRSRKFLGTTCIMLSNALYGGTPKSPLGRREVESRPGQAATMALRVFAVAFVSRHPE